MAFLTIGLTVGIATIVTLVTLTRSMSSDIERKMDEFGANILVTPQSNGLAMNYGGISLGGVTFDQRELREEDLAMIKTIRNSKNISTIMTNYCTGCHGSGPNSKGGIDLSTYAGVSAKIDRVYGCMFHLTGYSPMPQSSGVLDSCTLYQIKKWKNLGAQNN